MSDKEGTETNDVNNSKREPTQLLVRVFSDVLVDFLYLYICHYSGKYQNMEKPLKHQRRLGLRSYPYFCGAKANSANPDPDQGLLCSLTDCSIKFKKKNEKYHSTPLKLEMDSSH